jgi:hypothetical protein
MLIETPVYIGSDTGVVRVVTRFNDVDEPLHLKIHR